MHFLTEKLIISSNIKFNIDNKYLFNSFDPLVIEYDGGFGCILSAHLQTIIINIFPHTSEKNINDTHK